MRALKISISISINQQQQQKQHQLQQQQKQQGQIEAIQQHIWCECTNLVMDCLYICNGLLVHLLTKQSKSVVDGDEYYVMLITELGASVDRSFTC